ncbi:MFS transporter [Bacillus massiliglaciei]|uniref:MFS transporter n=1 Tax=Bacillus massiliglaciei TaxID=1816693 RepID=UPI000A877635|nr:MFS transporter [Bacillus massiliglaciei]
MEKTQSKQLPAGEEKIWTRDFLMICVANFFIFLAFQMTLPTIPLFVEDLKGSERLIGLVVGIFTFSALIIRPIAGKALESMNRKILFLIGLVIFVLSVGSFGFIGSIFVLFLIRIIQGVGWGISTTSAGTIVSDLIPPRRRGEGMGYFGLFGNVALAFGPSLGLILAKHISFHDLFLTCASVGLVATLLATQIKTKKIEKTVVPVSKARFDFYEKSALEPGFLIFFITVTFGGIATFLPLYALQKGLDGIYLYFLFFAISIMITRLFAGKLYDRKGHQAVFIPAVILILIAMLLLAWLPSNTVLFIAAVCYGFGFGSVQPALQAWSIEKSIPQRRGMANATYFSFFDLGIGTGAMVFGQIGYLYGYRSIYLTAAVSVFLSIVLYLWILQRTKKKAAI